MPVTRRAFLQYCAICEAALTIPGCCPPFCHNHGPQRPPISPPRGLDPPHIAHGQLPPWPVDPQIQARKEQIRVAWLNRPRPLRQDGMWPYLVIRAFPGDKGGRPTNPGSSPDILVAGGFPAPPPTSAPLFCQPDSPWTIYARVWNLGRLAAFAVALRVYSAWSEDLSRNYHNFQLIGGTYLNLGDITQRSSEQLVQFPVPWVPRQNAPPTAQSWALFAVASAATDPAAYIPPAVADSRSDRHVGSLFLDLTKWSGRNEGDLITQDSVDRIHYQIERGAVDANTVTFRLVIGMNASGWAKAIDLNDPTGALTWEIKAEGKGNSAENSIPANQIGSGSRLTFRKPKFLGRWTTVLELGDLDCLRGGDRVTFSWNADE